MFSSPEPLQKLQHNPLFQQLFSNPTLMNVLMNVFPQTTEVVKSSCYVSQ